MSDNPILDQIFAEQDAGLGAGPVPKAERPPQRVIVELLLIDDTCFEVNENAPYGTLQTAMGADIPVQVRGIAHDGDWIEVRLSNGSALGFPEARIARTVIHIT